jgi:transaldolase
MTAQLNGNPKKQKSNDSQLDQLKAFTVIVADTGDINAIEEFKPTDATTNPSLIYKAATMDAYQNLVEDAITYGKGNVADIMDKLAVNFGCEISKIVPGYVSTEVDARLSFDAEATIVKARKIIELYNEVGVDKSRILIKIASTWEGIQAALRFLRQRGSSCNLTLICSRAQGIAAAEANALVFLSLHLSVGSWILHTLLIFQNFFLSPPPLSCCYFTSFIHYCYFFLDFTGYEKHDGVKECAPINDPGVKPAVSMYNYYKKFGYKTVVMGATFRNAGEILQLSGFDKLTIALLAEGICSFSADIEKLEAHYQGKDGSMSLSSLIHIYMILSKVFRRIRSLIIL